MSTFTMLYGSLCASAYILNSPLEGIHDALWSPVEGKRGIWVSSVARREFLSERRTLLTRLPRWRLSSQIRWLKAFLVWLTLAKANTLSLYWEIWTNLCKMHFVLVTKNVICLTKYNMFNDGIEYITNWFW